MKKLLAWLLVAVMALGMAPASLADDAPTSATAWLLYFAAPSWWPQHKTVDQPESETGVVATNANVTGPGAYTVGLEFKWQTAESALQLNLVLENGEVAFPGYVVDITEIRVNGTPIEMKADNMYGTFHDDPDSGFTPIYNNYWNAVETPGSTGPDPVTMRAFDGVMDTEHYEIIDPAQIVAATRIEVDFTVAAEPGAEIKALGDRPDAHVVLDPKPGVPDNATTAYLYYQSGGWWPTATPDQQGDYTTVTITGEGHYTASAFFVDQGGWTPNGNGAEKLMLVIDSPAGTTMDGMYLGVREIRVNGTPIDFGGVAYGPTGYDNGNVFQADDGYAILFDKWMVENQPGLPWGHETWNGEDGTTAAVNPDDLSGVINIEVDFFVTSQQNVIPPDQDAAIWYPSNTVGLAGLSLKDLGISGDWHNIVPVNVTETGYQVYTLVGADSYVIGHAFVVNNNGMLTVEFKYVRGEVYEHSQCVKWYTSLDQLSAQELADVSNGQPGDVPVSVQDDLGGADVVYLSINNKVTYRDPVNQWGQKLPRYWRNMADWKAWRSELMSLIPVEAE